MKFVAIILWEQKCEFNALSGGELVAVLEPELVLGCVGGWD